MNSKKKCVSRPQNKQAGFSLLEVIISLAIMAMIGVAMWNAFTGGMRTLTTIPRTGETNLDILMLEQAFRRHLAMINIPFWVPEIELSNDSDMVELPYYLGYEDYTLFIYSETSKENYKEYLFIEGIMDDMDPDLPRGDDVVNFKSVFGPFEEISLEEVIDDDDCLLGIEVTVLPLQEHYGEVTIFGKMGGQPFWDM